MWNPYRPTGDALEKQLRVNAKKYSDTPMKSHENHHENHINNENPTLETQLLMVEPNSSSSA